VTYPQYQPPAAQPQGYPSQSYAPAYPPAPPMQYPPQQPAAAPTGQALTPPVPVLGQGGGGGGAAAPKPRHLLGRTIIVEPIRVDETAMDTSVNPPVNRPEAYFNLTVVDGGPVRYGDSQDRDVFKQRPNTHEIDTPCRFVNVNDRSQQFVKAVREALAAGEAGRVGVVEQGTKGNRPYMIQKCSTDVLGNARPDGDARYAAAMEIFGKIWHDKHAPTSAPRQFVNPEPRSLVAPPAAAPPQVAYGAPQQVPYPGAVPQGYVPTPYGAAPAAAVHPEYAAAVAQPGAQVYVQPNAPVLQQPVPPPVEAWLASLPEGQRAASRAAYLAQQQGQQPVAGPGI
jgi:hypothetical protein